MRRALAASLAKAQGAKALRDTLLGEQCGVSNQAKQACSAYAKQEKWLFRSPRLFSAEAAELDDGSKALERARRSSLWHQRITLLGAWPRAIKYSDCALHCQHPGPLSEIRVSLAQAWLVSSMLS
jgi:hypothetical protein